MCGVAGKSGLGEADETRSVMPGYQSVWIHVQLTPQDVLHNPPLRKNFRILDVFFQSCLQERRLGYCSHIGAGRFWVCFPAVMCGHVLLTSEWVFSFGFFLRSMNIRWTGDWCTGGLSRLLPSDHWDRLQHHLSPWSRISRITEDKWPDTCMLKVKGQFLGSWSVMEAEWCICFLSMADKIKITSLVSPSIGLFLPTKAEEKKQYTIEYTVVQSSHRGSLFAHQMISWTADHRSLPPAKAHDWTCWISWGEKWQGQRTQTVWNTKRTRAFQSGLLWLSLRLLQPHNTEAGWSMNAMLAQRWWDQLKIWREGRIFDLLAANLSQIHSPFSFNFLPFSPLFSITPPTRDWGWKIVWEWFPLQRMKCWVCPLLTVSPAHRLFMWLCEEQPLPLSAAHPHPSISHSARAGLGGSRTSFVVGNS